MSTDGLIPVPDDLEFGQTIRGFIEGQQVFGRYTLRQIVGRGGMGLVWLAHDEHLKEEVALKFLPELVRLDDVSLEELKRETRRSRKLSHSNIVKVYDFVSDATSAAISMEFVSGATLSSLRARREHLCFDVEEVRDWLRQLMNALICAHEDAKIVHRDLKPANIMVDETGKVKVTDFGIASSISESVSRVTVQRGTSGTLSYMSPQQALGEDPAITDDIYSLGATIYELLTSKPPFYTGDLLAQIREKTPASMTQRRAALGIDGALIPQEWEETIAACLAKEPGQRPQSAAEVAERLGLGSISATRSAKTVAPSITPPPVQPELIASIPEEPKKSRAMLITIVILLLIGGTCFGWYFGIERPAEQEKLQQAEIAEQDAITKKTEAEVKAATEAAEKAQLEAQAKQATDDAQKAKALADQKAKDEAASQEMSAPVKPPLPTQYSVKAKLPDDMRDTAQEAADLFKARQYDAAAAKYQTIIDKYPECLYAWSNLGVVRYQQGNLDEALNALQQAVKLSPTDSFSYANLGIVYYEKKQYENAIDALNAAKGLDPNDPKVRNYLGCACSQMGWQEAAEKEFLKAIELDPNFGDAHFNLALVYATEKPPLIEMARKEYTRAQELGIQKDARLEKLLGP